MNNDKPPIFGPSAVIDPATYEPRSSKSAFMTELMAELRASQDALAETQGIALHERTAICSTRRSDKPYGQPCRLRQRTASRCKPGLRRAGHDD